MKLHTTKAELTRAIASAKKVVDNRSSMPILECVVIETDKEKTTFHVTDLETALTISLETHKENEAGEAVVNLAILGKAVRTTKGDIILYTKEDKLVVKCDGAETALPVQSLDDFPIMRAWPAKTKTNETKAAGLLLALQSVSYAMSNDETRYNLHGVHIERDGRTAAKIIATNGSILGKTELSFKGKAFKGIIPMKAVTALLHLLKGAEEKVTLAIEDVREASKKKILHRLMHLRFNGIQMSIRLVDGEYPDWTFAIPKHNANSITFDRNALLEVSQKLDNLSGNGYHLLEIAFPSKDRVCEFKFAGEDEIITTIDLVCEISERADGAPERMAVNVNYLLATLKHCTGEKITLTYGDELDPMLIEEGKSLHLIMPMRL